MMNNSVVLTNDSFEKYCSLISMSVTPEIIECILAENSLVVILN